jgi:plastocyanin
MLAIAGLAALVVVSSSAFAATKLVTVSNFTFTPSTTKSSMGGTVQWTFPDAVAHTASDNTGLGLFNSGPKSGGQTFSFAFNAAGTYAVFCQIHTFMTSTVTVKPSAKPSKGGVTTVFKITWAKSALPAGLGEDVQIARLGGSFTPFLTNTTTTSANFTPDMGTGMYQFRARLRNAAGTGTGFSPTVTIHVS